MVARTLPGLGLTGYWDLGADGWKDAMDINLRVLSVIAGGLVKSRVTALPGSPALGDIYIVPSGAGSHPNEIAVYDGPTGAGAWVYLVPMKGWAFYVEDEGKNYQFNGTAWAEFAGAGSGGTYDLRFGFSQVPTSSKVLETIPIPRDITIPQNFVGSLGLCNTNPTASFTMTFSVDGISVGTIQISTAGAFTFASAADIDIAAGSIVRLVAPATVDATVNDVVITVLGDIQ